MTLEQLNERIDTIDNLTAILFEVFFDSDCTDPEVKAMFQEMRERFGVLHETARRDFNAKINDMSKQA